MSDGLQMDYVIKLWAFKLGGLMMKKQMIQMIISIVITIVISWFLFFPWKKEIFEDGGTIVYSSFTYKLYIWNKIGGKNTVELYTFPDNYKEISGYVSADNE